MKVIRTKITEIAANKYRVTLQLADKRPIEDATESIAITVQVETETDTPYLKEVEREALKSALSVIQSEIQARKVWPSPSS